MYICAVSVILIGKAKKINNNLVIEIIIYKLYSLYYLYII